MVTKYHLFNAWKTHNGVFNLRRPYSLKLVISKKGKTLPCIKDPIIQSCGKLVRIFVLKSCDRIASLGTLTRPLSFVFFVFFCAYLQKTRKSIWSIINVILFYYSVQKNKREKILGRQTNIGVATIEKVSASILGWNSFW